MSDITKCIIEGCPREKTCYRKTAPEDAWQSASDFGYYDNEDNPDDSLKTEKCVFYLNDKKWYGV